APRRPPARLRPALLVALLTLRRGRQRLLAVPNCLRAIYPWSFCWRSLACCFGGLNPKRNRIPQRPPISPSASPTAPTGRPRTACIARRLEAHGHARRAT